MSTDKEGPAKLADRFHPLPWTVQIDGLVNKPQTLDYDSLLKLAPLEERVYRHRCVEGWSMVIPWTGFPLKVLLDRVQPAPKAKFVAFTSVLRPSELPGQKRDVLDWPYREGLRLDEAMNPLTLLRWDSTERRCPTRTALRCASWCHGNMASRARSRL